MTGSALLQNAKLVELIKTRFLGVHPDELDCYLEYDDWTRIIAALSVPVSDFTPGIIENTEAGISELVIRDGPTVTGREMTVRPLLDMETREIVGFQWGSAPLPEVEGGDKGDVPSGLLRVAGCLHRYKDKGVGGWHWYDGAPSELSSDVYDIRPLYEIGPATAAERFAKWLEDGPKLAKAAGLYVGIKVSAAPSASIEGETP